MFNVIARAADNKLAWLVLFLSSSLLLIIALYFQHVMDLQPCIKCIYQRTAVIGILFSAALPVFHNVLLTRSIAFWGWGLAAILGGLIAHEHVDILYAANPFFVMCDIIPNFPSFMPLHEWLPAVFAAPGDCSENSWQFLGYGMAEWMRIIFAMYASVWLVVLSCRLAICRTI